MNEELRERVYNLAPWRLEELVGAVVELEGNEDRDWLCDALFQAIDHGYVREEDVK